MNFNPGDISGLAAQLGQISAYLYTLLHPNLILANILQDTVGMLLNVWFGFVLTTTDVEPGDHVFIHNMTISAFEPKVQLIADAGLVMIAIWAAYRIMWGHGLFTQYTARILLPRLFMAAVLINFALPLFQMTVDASNVVSSVAYSLNQYDNVNTFASQLTLNTVTSAGTMEVLTTAALAAGFGALAIAYLIRYAILILLAITAPLAALLFMLPETNHLSKMWITHFTTNLFMQPIQLFVMAIGFGLEHDGVSPIHHLFALASLLIVFKVPGAMGGGEKAAHKLQSTVHEAMTHIVKAVAKA
ncbi:MAG TPA: hypothetical protein VFR33_02505 [Candidatus Dormibacteraeota bacterium]|nr:hypothetical protein [Candidatus Dormibacteraeota bacterium]